MENGENGEITQLVQKHVEMERDKGKGYVMIQLHKEREKIVLDQTWNKKLVIPNPARVSIWPTKG